MKKEYVYYIKCIKRLEKKIAFLNNIYCLTNIQYFKNKKESYNKLLITYYKILKFNINNFPQFKETLDKFN